MPWYAQYANLPDTHKLWADPGSELEEEYLGIGLVEVPAPVTWDPGPGPDPATFLVRSINGKQPDETGAVVLTPAAIGAIPVPTGTAAVGQLVAVAEASSGTPAGFGLIPFFAPAPSGDTTGATDRAALQAALDAIPATGGALRLRAGAYYLGATGLTVDRPTKIEGAGGVFAHDSSVFPGKATTTLYLDSTTGVALDVTAPGCTFLDFAVVNEANAEPTAGAGINISPGYNTHLNRVTIAGFYDNLVISGWYYMVDSCHFYDAAHYGVYLYSGAPALNDHADCGFINNAISMSSKNYTPLAAVRWEGGGGMRFMGNKINGRSQVNSPPLPGGIGVWDYGFDLYFTVVSIDLNMIGNSIANCSNALLRITTTETSAGFNTATITGNLFDSAVDSCVAIEVGAPTTVANNSIRSIHIADNTIAWMPGVGIKAYNARGLYIGPNTWGPSVAGPLIQLGGGLDNGSGLLGCRVDAQSVGVLDGIDIIQDLRGFANSADQLSGGVVYDYTRHCYVPSNGVWQTFAVLTVSNGSGGIITMDVNGQNGNAAHNTANNKGVAIRQVRAYDVTTSGAVTLTTVGADVAAGAGAAFVAVQAVLAANTITLQVQTTDATQVALWAQARVRVDGKLTKYRKGA